MYGVKEDYMTRKSSLMSKLLVFMLAFAVVFTYSVLPMNQAFAASKKPGKVKLSSVKATSSSTIKVTWKKASNAKKYPVLDGSKLTCETIKAVTFCEDCKQEYETVAHGKTCPHCGSGNTYLVTGNEVILKEVIAD